MTAGLAASTALVGLPLIGALASLACWSQPNRLRTCSIVAAGATLAVALGSATTAALPSDALLFVCLLPIAAMTSLLGQPAHPLHRHSWLMTLVFLGLGMGALTQAGPIRSLFLAAIAALASMLLFRHHSPLWPMSWLGIIICGSGSLAAVAATVAEPRLSAHAMLVAAAVLLPLVPLHSGFLGALTRLPGSLPPFLVVLLPLTGFQTVMASISVASDSLTGVLTILAGGGAAYGALKAPAQSRVRLRLAYGSLSFLSISWWFAATHGSGQSAAVFVGAVALATSGLLSSWQIVRTRYGDDVDPQAVSGLASSMPRYAVLFSLLALAAIGLPPFGVFAGFVGLLLSPNVSFSAVFVVVLAAWLAASWYVLDMAQRLLFGAPRADLRHADLHGDELAALLVPVLVLIALGVVPSDVFSPGSPVTPATAEMGRFAWNVWTN